MATVEARRGLAYRTRVGVASLAAAAALAVALAAALYAYPPSWTIVLAGGLGLLAALGAVLARTEFAVGAGVLLLGVVRFEPGPPDVIFGVVLVVALATAGITFERVPRSILVLTTLFVALQIASMASAVAFESAVRFVIISIYLAALAVWMTSFLDSDRRAQFVVRCYVLGAVAVAALGVLALWVAPLGATPLLEPYGYRATGTFKDPNVFGQFLIPAALVTIDEILAPKLLWRSRFVKIAALATLVVGVLFSYSRAAWVCMVAGTAVIMLVAVLRRGGGRAATNLVVVAVVAFAAVLAAVAFTGSIGFIEERAQLHQYDTERFAAQQSGLALVAEHPLGIGPAQFEEALSLSAHSTYVRSIVEQGIPGLLVLLGLMLVTLAIATRNAIRGYSTHGIGSAPLLASWVALLIASVAIDTIHWRHLWFVAALVWAGAAPAAIVRR